MRHHGVNNSKEVAHMTKYREILRLASLGLSQQNIADSSGVSKKTVNRVLKRAKELNIFGPLEANETDAVLVEKLFPSAQKQVSSTKRMPDFNYIQKELLRNGVNKKLLWTEYLEECRQSGDEPLMYSQFCYYIQQDEQKRRATMHINRKPDEHRSRSTGLEIPLRSRIQIPARSSRLFSL